MSWDPNASIVWWKFTKYFLRSPGRPVALDGVSQDYGFVVYREPHLPECLFDVFEFDDGRAMIRLDSAGVLIDVNAASDIVNRLNSENLNVKCYWLDVEGLQEGLRWVVSRAIVPVAEAEFSGKSFGFIREAYDKQTEVLQELVQHGEARVEQRPEPQWVPDISQHARWRWWDGMSLTADVSDGNRSWQEAIVGEDE